MARRIAALAAGLLASLWLALSAPPSPAQDASAWPSGDPRYQQRGSGPPSSEALRDPPGRYEVPIGASEAPYAWALPRVPAYRVAQDDAYHPPRPQGYDGTYSADPPYPSPRDDTRRPPRQAYDSPYNAPPSAGPRDDTYRPPRSGYDTPYPAPPPAYGSSDVYGRPYTPAPASAAPPSGYGRPYGPPSEAANDPAYPGYGPGPHNDDGAPGGYSSREILDTGHSFFGSISKGLAGAVEYSFQKLGRPNGYILGQEAGGAFVAGFRFGEGTLYTRDAGTRRVYWQGPSIGWDAGAEGSKVMMLVYNLSDPEEIYQRFGGVDGSAYLVGGVGVTFEKSGDVIVAPIRAGVGLRLGANVGYLKYTRAPTWNPF
jgi:hypothetical protein